MKKKKFTREERVRYDTLLKQMRRYERQGVELTLSGERCSPQQLASACAVREHGCYMGDYIWDEQGELKEIHYDKIGQTAGSETVKS